MKIILEKNITKNKNTKETGKKPSEEILYQSIVFCEEILYQSIVFCEEKIIFICN